MNRRVQTAVHDAEPVDRVRGTNSQPRKSEGVSAWNGCHPMIEQECSFVTEIPEEVLRPLIPFPSRICERQRWFAQRLAQSLMRFHDLLFNDLVGALREDGVSKTMAGHVDAPGNELLKIRPG